MSRVHSLRKSLSLLLERRAEIGPHGPKVLVHGCFRVEVKRLVYLVAKSSRPAESDDSSEAPSNFGDGAAETSHRGLHPVEANVPTQSTCGPAPIAFHRRAFDSLPSVRSRATRIVSMPATACGSDAAVTPAYVSGRRGRAFQPGAVFTRRLRASVLALASHDLAQSRVAAARFRDAHAPSLRRPRRDQEASPRQAPIQGPYIEEPGRGNALGLRRG